MIIIPGDAFKYQGNTYALKSSLPLPISMPEFRKKCDNLFKCSYSFCGYTSIWEIIDDKLYLVSSKGKIEVNDKEKYREEKLRLRKLLRRGEITPTQNGHMLKAFSKQTRFEKEMDLEFMLGKPAPIFADWITTVIPFPVRIEEDGFKTNHSQLQWRQMAYLHVQEGKLVKTSFEKPGNLKEDIWPDFHPEIKPAFPEFDKVLFSEENMARIKEEQLKALRNAVFKISPFKFGKDPSPLRKH